MKKCCFSHMVHVPFLFQITSRLSSFQDDFSIWKFNESVPWHLELKQKPRMSGRPQLFWDFCIALAIGILTSSIGDLIFSWCLFFNIFFLIYPYLTNRFLKGLKGSN